MAENPKQIDFYLDYISHNAYIAWEQIHRMAKKYGMQVEPVPVLFAGLLQAHNQLGPAEVPAKLKWMTHNVIRKASILNIPLKAPAFHPFNPLLSLRASLIDLEREKQKELVDHLFRAVWVEKRDVSNTEVISEIFSKCRIQAEDALAECQSQKVKDKLRRNTEQAIAQGVFGVPTMIIDGELFWGYDDFPYMEMFLRGEDPDMQHALDEWAELRSQARRKQDPQFSK